MCAGLRSDEIGQNGHTECLKVLNLTHMIERILLLDLNLDCCASSLRCDCWR